jgi:hypothetical protein
MAQRRIARALANFGLSLQDIAGKEMQQKMYLDRQAEESRLIGERQREAFEREQVEKLREGLRSGKVLPQQVSEQENFKLTGGSAGNLLQFTPPEANVLAPITEDLGKITKAGQVPSAGELMGRRLSSGQPIKDLTGINNVIAQAAQQKTRLQDSEAFDRDAAIAQKFAETYETGQAENAVADATHGDVMKRTAVEDAQKVKTAGQTAFAQRSGNIRADIQHAAATLKMKTDEEMMKARVHEDARVAASTQAAILKSQQTTAESIPRLYELADAWRQAGPKLKGIVGSSETYAALLDNFTRDPTTFRATIARANLPKEVNMYFDKLNASLSYLARSTGEVGNLAGQEQLWQRYGAPSALDVVQGTADQKMVNMLAFTMAQPELARMNMDPRVIALAPEVKLDLVEQIVGKNRQNIQERMFPKATGNEDAEKAALIQSLKARRR